MQEPHLPRQENLRIATLRNLKVLDTPAEERFDRLVRIAQRCFDVPIALISLVDSERQWFKAKLGIAVTELPRCISFCGHTILQRETFVVSDSRQDCRFSDNPLVTGKPHIRFYAGQPIRATNGTQIGTFCILDYKPRQISEEDSELLKDLAAQAEVEINNPDLQRMTSTLIKSENELLETIALLEKKEQRERCNIRTLEMVSRGKPLKDILENIVQGIEQQNPDMIGCIMILDQDSSHFKIGAAPSMPGDCTAALDGIPLNQGLDSCEASPFFGDSNHELKPRTHPYWSNFSKQARKASFAYCWSQAIVDALGDTMGILSICKRQLGYPNADDLMLIEESVSLSSLAIERNRTDTQVKNQALFDPLTQLPNRNMLKDRLEQEMYKANRNNTQVAILFLDLDHFKKINDRLGHNMGDLLLAEAAQRLLKCVRMIDTVARLGGDEFIIIMGEINDTESVERVAGQIIESLQLPFRLGEQQSYISASIGISLYPDNGLDMQSLVRNADQAMYEAKKKGRNRFQYFAEALQEHALKRIELLSDLRIALAKNQLKVCYQPVVDLLNGNIVKSEAQIRWKHPQRGVVNPREFLPLAEESGLIIELGEWFFEQVLQQLIIWRSRFNNRFQVSINTASLHYRESGGALQHSLKRLSAVKLPAGSLCIEISENLMMENRAVVSEFFQSLKQINISVALDNFGTGFTCLQNLQELDIDYLKLDRALIQNLGDDPGARQLCEALILMAHRLDIKVIAKGVETELQRAQLVAAGCDFAQGSLYSPAACPNNFPSKGNIIRNRAL